MKHRAVLWANSKRVQPCLVNSSLRYDLIILHAGFVTGVLSCILIAGFLLGRFLCSEQIEDLLNLSKPLW